MQQQGAEDEKGEHARLSAFLGAQAVADLVKTTLGPKGMDKILQGTTPEGGLSKKITVTNDGATILKSIFVDNPAAKILVDISKTQDDEVGDGTTSVVVLAGELLREAERLIDQKIHPQTVVQGWRKAITTATDALERSSVDNRANTAKFRRDLIAVAKTTMSSKIITSDDDHFAKLAVDAVLRLKGSSSLESIQIIKKLGGQMKDSFLADGFILDKQIGVGQPKRMENATILCANTAMDTDKIKIFGAKVKVSGLEDVAKIEKAEKSKMKVKVDKILKHKANVFINRQLIYDYPQQLFADAGVMAIEHADFEGIERLAAVLGAEITSTFEHPELVQLGECELIEEMLIGEDRVIKFSGAKAGAACSIVLRGATQHIIDEAERSLHDALCVLTTLVRDSRTVMGGGSSEMLMAHAVDELARKTSGKESHAIEAFARALRQMPTIIADNAGLDSSELVAQLRSAHTDGKHVMGLDIVRGEIGDMRKLRITEPLRVRLQAVISAHEAAEMILRVDEIIKQPPRQRSAH